MTPDPVIPAKAGIHSNPAVIGVFVIYRNARVVMDSRLRGNDKGGGNDGQGRQSAPAVFVSIVQTSPFKWVFPIRQ